MSNIRFTRVGGILSSLDNKKQQLKIIGYCFLSEQHSTACEYVLY